MSFWNRAPRPPRNVITADQLADYGRYEFLGAEASGIENGYPLIEELAELIYMGDPAARAHATGELRRHAAAGEWEKVGAWRFAKDFLAPDPGIGDLTDNGLLALAQMRVANLGFVLASADMDRYAELTGGPVPNNRFFGPPVFDSEYGPSRRYYTDNAVAALARRSTATLSHHPGIDASLPSGAADCLHSFGLLVHLGPLAVGPYGKVEAITLHPVVAAADAMDHLRLVRQLAREILAPGQSSGFAAIGAARFAEDYLVPETLATEDYQRLLDGGLRCLIATGDPGLLDPGLLTPRQRTHLDEIQERERTAP
jgi:hypothetical protein